jgi:hypothetical protein
MNSLYFSFVQKTKAFAVGIAPIMTVAAAMSPILLPLTAIAFSSESLQAQQETAEDPETRIRQMYEEIVGNEPDEDTVEKYLQAHDRGWNFSRIRSTMARSNAAQQAVETVYQEILEREPEEDVLRSWLKALSRGWSLQEVRGEVATTLETKALINRIYQEVLNRQADRKGMETWTDALARGWTLEEVREEIATSSEAQDSEDRQE